MDDQGLSPITDELPELSALPTQDIPTAVRETAAASRPKALAPQSHQSSRKWRRLILGLGAVALVVPLGLLALRSQIFLPQSTAQPSPAASASPASPTVSQTASPTALLGHLRYSEAPADELVPLSVNGGISLRKAAVEKFEKMLAAATADGVSLSVISGFRSVAEQDGIFFDVKAERGEDSAERAAVSAPPGYSEHHTGYAVDIGDADAPSADLQFAFEQTKAFKWLEKNAAYYSFEMSFPKGNPMGVSYEPWHWRFVGDRQSLETFYRARATETPQPTPQTSPAQSPDSSTGAVQ